MSPTVRSALTMIMAIILIAAYLGQGWGFITTASQTFDEAAHLAAGYSYLATGDFRLNHEHPPLLKLWQALPVYLIERVPFSPNAEWWEKREEWRIGHQFLYGCGVPPMRMLIEARSANLLLGAALVGLIGWWTFRLWGRIAALTAMGFAAFDPTLIAHGGTISTDVGGALFMTLTIYLLWEYVRSPSQGWLIGTGVALGLALASKLTALLLLPALVGVIVAYLFLGGSLMWPNQESSPGDTLSMKLRQAWGPLVRVLVIAGLVLPLAYLGYGFPEWAAGLRYQLERGATGEPSYFFFGEVASKGWWAYYPVTLAIKTPLGTLLAIAASLLLFRIGQPLRGRDAVFLMLPAGLLFAVIVIGRVNLGVRYLLPVLPFLFVIAGRLATVRGVIPNAAVAGLLAWTATSSLTQSPHALAYFNELAGGPDGGAEVISDSNVDWGQDLPALKSFMEHEGVERVYLSYFGTADPSAYGIDAVALPSFGALQPPPDVTPPAGRQLLAVSVVNLQGIYLKDHREMYRWLDGRTPLACLGHSLLVYDLTGDEDALARVRQLTLPVARSR